MLYRTGGLCQSGFYRVTLRVGHSHGEVYSRTEGRCIIASSICVRGCPAGELLLGNDSPFEGVLRLVTYDR